jgi:hypothetical protein
MELRDVVQRDGKLGVRVMSGGGGMTIGSILGWRQSGEGAFVGRESLLCVSLRSEDETPPVRL